MIEDRKLTRVVTWLCNNGEYKTFKQVAVVQLRWSSDVPEVDPNPLGFVIATQWQLTPPDQHEYNVFDQTARLNEVMKIAEAADNALVELNMGNYNDDDVQEAQNGICEASSILRSIIPRGEQ